MKNGKIKPILLSPSPELRKRIEEEAKRQNRSMNNLLIVILTKVFHQKELPEHRKTELVEHDTY